MTLETAAPPTEELASDERWAAWIAKSRKHDRTTRTRVRVLFTLVAGAAALWLLVVLLQ